MLRSANGYPRLRPRQQRALVALLAGKTAKAAAETADVSYATVRRWLQEPTFQQALAQAEQAILQDLQARLTALGVQAVMALEDSLAPHQDPRIRLRAARVTLEHLLRLRELVDLEARVRQLEEALEVRNGTP